MVNRVTTRFAPSPTGHLHVGNIRTALFNWLFSRRYNGSFILRLDDTDAERSKREFETTIIEDLNWLGLTYDNQYRQSARLSRYQEMFNKLKENKRVYPCYETAEELALMRHKLRTAGKPPIYNRSALNLSQSERQKLEIQGRSPHWRFLLSETDISWKDSIRGEVRFPRNSFSDPVLLRADGLPLYTLTSVIDDADLKVTHVIRGEDHVANTAVQLELFAAISASKPSFAHHALLTGPDGEALSKRLGTSSIRDLRDQGFQPLALTSMLATLGSSQDTALLSNLSDLITVFSLDNLGRAPVRFNVTALERINTRLLQEMPFSQAQPLLQELSLNAIDEEFWLAIRANINTLTDTSIWWNVCYGSTKPLIEEGSFTASAANLLPNDRWDTTTWKTWTKAVSNATGRKGQALFRPLRLALTGRERGPEMNNLLPLIEPKRARARLHGRTA